MINIIDYVNLCSDALLCIIDNDITNNDNLYLFIDFSNKQIKEKFEFYLKSQLLSKYVYGKYNVIINSCHPKNNWRNYEKLIINKYIITDKSIKIDIKEFEVFTDKLFSKITKEIKNFSFISLDEIDIFDIMQIIKKFNICNLNKTRFCILENGNRKLVHDIDIPNYIFQEVEIILKDCRLIY